MKITFKNTVGNIQIYMDCLRAICGETEGKSMIDLMCAFAPNTPKLGFHPKQRTYVDVIDRKLDHADQQQFFIKDDVFSFMNNFGEVQELQADVAICSDGIEHLNSEDGQKLLVHMQRISDKQIIFTPLGDLWIEKIPTDNPEAHRSAWYPEMLPGWATIVFPQYHKEWGTGAFFAFKCNDTQEEYARVLSLLMKMKWYDQMVAE